MFSSLPVGFFDSGVGGLSVYAKFRELLPNENTLYYGDLLHLPYGNKSQQELIRYAKHILDFYKDIKVKAVVIACNTSSAYAYEFVKHQYNFNIYPIIQSCAQVIANMQINKIGVFATEATVQSKAYTKELLKYNPRLKVCEIACPNWVGIVENKLPSNINPDEDINNKLEEMMQFHPDKIILGCTHYPYLRKDLAKIVSNKLFVDPAEIFVNSIKNDLCRNSLLNLSDSKGQEKFYVSANPNIFEQNARFFYNLNVEDVQLV